MISVVVAAMTVCPSILAKDTTRDEKPDEKTESGRHTAVRILPQPGVAMRVPQDFRLYDPDGPRPPDEYIEHERPLPIWGEKLTNREYALPRPFDVSIIGIGNSQDQTISELDLKLGKGAVPPEDETLRAFPAVTLDSSSETQSAQLNADLWLLPFLNVFASLGRVTGEPSLSINIDLADAPELCIPDPRPTLPRDPPRPPICSDNEFAGSFLLPIKSDTEPTTATFGLTGAFSAGKWFGAVTGSYTESYGDKASDVSNFERRVACRAAAGF